MAWVLLLFAGLLEIVWAYSMKLSQGFTRRVAAAALIVGGLILMKVSTS